MLIKGIMARIPIENGMKNGEFQRVVVVCYADGRTRCVNDLHKLLHKQYRDKSGGQIENQMCAGESLALNVGAHRANNGCNGGTDVCSNGKSQAVLIGDLLCRQGGDN